MKISMEDLHYI